VPGPQCTAGSTGRRNALSWRERWSVAMDQAFVEGLRRPRRWRLQDRCDVGSARKTAIQIQHITLIASGAVGRTDDPNSARTNTMNKPAPQNRAIVFRMSKPGGSEGIVVEITFVVACMAVPFVDADTADQACRRRISLDQYDWNLRMIRLNILFDQNRALRSRLVSKDARLTETQRRTSEC
jgi:hypothetical protein